MLLVGVTPDDQSRKLQQLYLDSGSPIYLIHTPILFLSTPDEKINKDFANDLASDDDWLEVTPLSLAYPYNPSIDTTECHVVVEAPRINELRKKYLVNPVEKFTASYIMAYDPLRSATARAFLLDFAYSLSRLPLRFELMVSDDANHFIEKSFNNLARPILNEAYDLAKAKPNFL
jgi:hypothetical protein